MLDPYHVWWVEMALFLVGKLCSGWEMAEEP
jgi:hypothetical protein